MPDAEVRAVQPDEHLAWLRSARRTFLEARRSDEEDVALARRRWEGQRLVGAFDGGRVVATFRSWDAPLPVPGGALAADHVSSVTVAPTHRRRGLMARLVTDDLRAARERGVPLAVLIAAEAPIYGRFGFGAATEQTTLEVDRPGGGGGAAPLAHLPAGTDDVVVELVDDADLRGPAPAVRAAAAAAWPGAVRRDDLGWDRALGLVAVPGQDVAAARPALLATGPGGPGGPGGAVLGYARLRATDDWTGGRPRSRLEVTDLAATTAAASAALWRQVLVTDLVGTVRAPLRPAGDPLGELLADRRHLRRVDGFDWLHVRVLDVRAALAGRRYRLPGRAVVEVVDDVGLAGGRWSLEVGDDGAAAVEATRAEPGAVLDVGVLGAVLLGEVPLARLAAAGRATGDPAALAALGALLAWAPDGPAPTLDSF